MTDAGAAVGIDIGGTKVVAAVLSASGEVSGRRRATTPAPRGAAGGPQALVELVVELADDLGPTLPVGVAVAALVGTDGLLAYAPNLSVGGLALGDRLRSRLRRPVAVLNDATAAGAAEHRTGAGRGHDHVVMATVGTGVGGAVVTHGQLLLGAHGHGAELGHVVVDAGGATCACGNRGCLEAYASGTALERTAREGLVDLRIESVLRGRERIVGRDVTDAAAAGDAYAVEIIERAGWWLGVGLAGFVNIFDPTIVIVGGGATVGAGPWLLPAATSAMADHVQGARHRTLPPVVRAQLGDDAGFMGAALAALEAGT